MEKGKGKMENKKWKSRSYVPCSIFHFPFVVKRRGVTHLRSILLIVTTLLILIAGFLVYLTFQPRPKAAESQLKLHPAPLVEGGRSGAFNSGLGVWVKKYDTNGRLSSQLRAAQYDPIGPDTIQVTRPEARFFLSDGQVLRITGAQGAVMTESAIAPPGHRSIAGAPTEMPQRGRLEHVMLQLYSMEEIRHLDQGLPAHARLTATMNNAVFDANASRIYTDDCTIDGRHVPGHQVPVLVTGDDYDFSGQGLLVQWNERLHQLTLLEVHRGRSLTIKHPGTIQTLSLQSPPSPEPASAAPASPAPPPSTTQTAPRPTTTSSRPSSPEPRQTAYRATFEQNVRIFQGRQLLGKAMIMQVDFLPRPQSSAAATTLAAPPEDRSTAPGQDHHPSHPSAATLPTSTAAAEKPPASQPAPPAEEPIIVHWAGPLRVTPLANTNQESLQPGQTAVHLLGAPVTLTRQDGTLVASSVLYRSADQSVELHGLLQSPVVMTDGQGSTITTQSMIYRPRQHQAQLFGQGRASGLADAQHLDARWSKQATIHFRPAAAQDQADIESVSLQGAVRVDHPQLHLQSDRLNLSFAPVSAASEKTTTNTLRSLTAAGNVHARLLDKQNGEQRLSAQKLDLTMARTPAGQSFPQVVQADEQVHAHLLQRDQQLWADHLTVHLKPADEPDSQSASPNAKISLKSLDAQGHVRLSDPRSGAQANELHVVMMNEHPAVTLRGRPATLSGPNGDHLTGPVIHYTPDQRKASVVGPGQLSATQQAGPTTRPLHVAWTKGIQIDGDANRIDLTGQVVATSTDSDGAAQTAQGDRLTLWLVDTAPKASPTTSSSQTLAPMENNFMAGKEVRRAEFIGHASLQSLRSDDGKVLRRLYLQAPRINYDLPAQRLLVPAPGQMLVEDHQSADSATTTAPSARGNTAFVWSKHLTFDQSAHQATLTGDVRIVHKPDAETSGLPFTLQSQQAIARFSPNTNGGTSKNPASQREIQLQRLVAQDRVAINSQGRQVNADRITYDPSTGLLKAVGSNQDPVHLQSDDGSVSGRFESLTYNLKQDKIVKMENAQFRGRR